MTTLATATLTLPQFTHLSLDALTQQIEQVLTTALQAIQQFPTQRITADDALAHINAFDQLENQLNESWGILSHLNAVKNTTEVRERHQALLPQLSHFYTTFGQHQGIYQAYKQVAESTEFAQLDAAQRQAIRLALRDFQLSGVALMDDKKQRFSDICTQLSQLSATFSNHVLDATQAFSLILQPAQLAGLPESSISLLTQYGQTRGLNQSVVTLDAPAYLAVMTYADDRALREQLYKAYTTRASEFGDANLDNSALMLDIVQLRQEKAQLLGFAHYVDYSLASKMAPDAERVDALLRDLANHAKQPAQAELAQLSADATADGITQLQPWDVAYYAEKLKQREFSLSQVALKPYFPAPTVVAGLFSLVHDLYGIDIKEKQADVWDDAVCYYEVYDQGQLLGGFYLDLYTRANKRGGAWMAGFRSRMRTQTGLQHPVAFLVCNFSPPSAAQPALLTHDDVLTLFHEFGHGLHHLLTEVDYIGVAGTHGVAWDAVELPSQIMELWAWDAASLQRISAHVDTQAPLPDTMLHALFKARRFQTGMQTLRQVEFALFDLHIHQHSMHSQTEIQACLHAIRADYAIIPVPSYNRFQHSFSHIFSGGYAAGYYSYKWAEVLASDAFERFEEEGLFNTETGHAFRTHILAIGGAHDALHAFEAFRGRPPTTAALLRQNGRRVN